MKHKAVTQRILAWMLALALLFTGILPANTASLTVNAASTTKSSNENHNCRRISDQNSGR